MKKRFAGIAALGLALSLTFGMTVCAAGSPTTDSGYTDSALEEAANNTQVADQTVTVDGKTVEVKLETAPVTVVQQQQAETTIKNSITTISNAVDQAVSGTVSNVKVEKVLPGIQVTPVTTLTKEEIAKVGVPVSIQNSAIVSGKTYMILHTKDDGTTEILGPVTASNNTVTVKFYSFSTATPIEVSYDVEKGESGDSHWEGGPDYDPNDGKSDTATSGPVSPKTGEVLPLVGFMAVICLAGAVVSVRKARN